MRTVPPSTLVDRLTRALTSWLVCPSACAPTLHADAHERETDPPAHLATAPTGFSGEAHRRQHRTGWVDALLPDAFL
jgi:hypothetical protein